MLLLAGCGGEDLGPWNVEHHGLTAKVEQWRALVEKHFEPQHVTWGLNIIACESGGDPNAYNSSSGASGLFQHLQKYWPARAKAAGFDGYSPFHPEANIAASAYLLYASGGGPGHWVCKSSPFEDFDYVPQHTDGGSSVVDPPEPSLQPVQPCTALDATGGVVDDASPCFHLFGPASSWRSVTGEGYGGGLHWTNATQAASPSNWARWDLNLSAAGRYQVHYYAVATYALFSDTRYLVRHGGQETALTIDQSAGVDGWRLLGTFDFQAGDDQYVAAYDNISSPVDPGQHIVADAIKLEPAVTAAAPLEPSPEPPGVDHGGTDAPAAAGPGRQTLALGGCNLAGEAGGAHDPRLALLLALLWLLARQGFVKSTSHAAPHHGHSPDSPR